MAICSQLLRKRYPHACQSLLDQLANSIHIRTMSLVHLQSHNEKLGYQRQHQEDVDQHHQTEVTTAVSETPGMVNTTESTGPLSPSSHDTYPTTVSPSTAMREYRVRQKPSGSIVSHGSMTWEHDSKDLPYPDIPKRMLEAAFVFCSICSDPLPASTLSEDKWRYGAFALSQLYD